MTDQQWHAIGYTIGRTIRIVGRAILIGWLGGLFFGAGIYRINELHVNALDARILADLHKFTEDTCFSALDNRSEFSQIQADITELKAVVADIQVAVEDVN